MLKVVVDTNVIVSALHFGGNPDKVLSLANQGAVELLVSPFILDEVAGVLRRKFSWDKGEIDSYHRNSDLDSAHRQIVCHKGKGFRQSHIGMCRKRRG